MSIHKLRNGKYACNGACGISENKYSRLWDKVTCKNCLKQRPEEKVIRCCGEDD